MKKKSLFLIFGLLFTKVFGIVSNLVDNFTEKELLNRKIVVVTNLKPTKFRGVESNGMLLVTEDDTKMELVSGGKVANGTRLS